MSIRAEIIRFCQSIGSNPLLVQGAGGNISWKDESTLWVKGSGVWLSEAGKKDIFVPVDLTLLRASLYRKEFDVYPRVLALTTLKPSIETFLHALMPHKIVIHLHPVELLAWLVRDSFEKSMQAVDWAVHVPYRKPGKELAQFVFESVVDRPSIFCLFLQNHGLVLGGSTIVEIQQRLSFVLAEMRSPLLEHTRQAELGPLTFEHCSQSYRLLDDYDMQGLVLDDILYERLSSAWALYPDHVVFLGKTAACYDSIDDFSRQVRGGGNKPRIVFVKKVGIYVVPNLSRAEYAQLRCYYDVIIRVPKNSKIVGLTEFQVNELLNWDAEKFRINEGLDNYKNNG